MNPIWVTQMASSTAEDHNRSDSGKSSSYSTYLCIASVAACVVARAPTMIDDWKIPIIDLPLKLNAGYVLVFGPLLIVCAIAAIMYLSEGSHRKGGRGGTSAGLLSMAIPCLAAAFLSLQFFLLLAPDGQCNTFPRWRYLTDWTLSAFKPEYCMSLPAETQGRMPWLAIPFAQAWGQVLLPLIAVGLVVKDGWRARRARS